MQKKLLSLILAVAFVLSCTLVGCAKKQETPAPQAEAVTEAAKAAVENVTAGKDPKDCFIGFCGMTLNNEYHIILANAVKKTCEEKGIKCEIQAGRVHASVDEQLPIIENFISQGVDGIILVPAASAGLLSALEECKKANIPVINLDTQLDQATRDALGQEIPFYGTDNFVGGKLVGTEFKKMFPNGAKVAILRGVQGQTNDDDRYNGFKETAGNIDLVFEQHANWETDLAYTAIQNCLQANPDLEAIYCENDLMGIGSYQAVEEAGLKDKIKIFSYDGISEGIKYVVDGKFVLTCAQQPIQMGKLGVENMIKVFEGKNAETYIDTGCAIIDSTNCNEKLAEVMKYTEEILQK